MEVDSGYYAEIVWRGASLVVRSHAEHRNEDLGFIVIAAKYDKCFFLGGKSWLSIQSFSSRLLRH